MTIPANLNPTRLCSCGAPKAISSQWCDSCWDALPKSSALRYVRQISRMRAQLRNSQALITRAHAATQCPSDIVNATNLQI